MEDRTGLYVRDDLYVEDVIRVYGDGKFEKDIILVNGGTLYIGDKTLKQYIKDIINSSK